MADIMIQLEIRYLLSYFIGLMRRSASVEFIWSANQDHSIKSEPIAPGKFLKSGQGDQRKNKHVDLEKVIHIFPVGVNFQIRNRATLF